ncbi:MAG: SRPBCC domain-containing protein [Rhodothermales bacterium]
MEQPTTDTTTQLRLERHYHASPEAVFAALTEPALLARWFAPTDEMEAVIDRFEARVDAPYRIEMHAPSGDVHVAIGEIREVVPNERLVYTWKWEGGEMGDTLVTWTLEASESGTVLRLLHDQFPDEEARDRHLVGWNGCLARLQPLLV